MNTKEFCKITGQPERRIISWADKGLLRPFEEMRATSMRRDYNQTDVEEVRIISCLTALGFNWHSVKNYLAIARSEGLVGESHITLHISDYATLTFDLDVMR